MSETAYDAGLASEAPPGETPPETSTPPPAVPILAFRAGRMSGVYNLPGWVTAVTDQSGEDENWTAALAEQGVQREARYGSGHEIVVYRHGAGEQMEWLVEVHHPGVAPLRVLITDVGDYLTFTVTHLAPLVTLAMQAIQTEVQQAQQVPSQTEAQGAKQRSARVARGRSIGARRTGTQAPAGQAKPARAAKTPARGRSAKPASKAAGRPSRSTPPRRRGR